MKELLVIAVSSAFVSNVVLSQFLGICSFVGVSKKVETAAGMGGAVIFVITIASIAASLLYKLILQPLGLDYLKTIVFILVIAALVQIVEMFLKKCMVSLYNALGVFLPLIVVNCIILGRAEMFASKNNPIDSVLDGLGMGMGFTLTLFMMGAIRELLGSGSIFGVSVLSTPIAIFGVAPGGFIVFGCLVALVNKITSGKAIKKKEFSCADCPVASVCGQSKLACEKGEC